MKRDVVLPRPRAQGPLWFWITSTLPDSQLGGVREKQLSAVLLIAKAWEQMKWMRGCEDVTAARR